jgi:hypothetical protein
VVCNDCLVFDSDTTLGGDDLMTLKIKFSHTYLKMPEGYEKSQLMAVFNTRREDLGLDFILYDTEYINPNSEEEDVDYYPLPKGDYMVLLLKAIVGEGELWTTIRRRTPEKEAYYRANIGQIFDCVVVP